MIALQWLAFLSPFFVLLLTGLFFAGQQVQQIKGMREDNKFIHEELKGLRTDFITFMAPTGALMRHIDEDRQRNLEDALAFDQILREIQLQKEHKP